MQEEVCSYFPSASSSPSVSPTISLAPSAAPTVECNAGGSSCAGKVGCRKKRKMQEEICSYFPSASPSPSSHTSIDEDTVGGPANVSSTSVSGQKATKKKRKVKKTKMPKKKKTKVPKAKKTRDPKKKAKKIAIDTNTTEVPIN